MRLYFRTRHCLPVLIGNSTICGRLSCGSTYLEITFVGRHHSLYIISSSLEVLCNKDVHALYAESRAGQFEQCRFRGLLKDVWKAYCCDEYQVSRRASWMTSFHIHANNNLRLSRHLSVPAPSEAHQWKRPPKPRPQRIVNNAKPIRTGAPIGE
jgi:hypothetical protein